MIAQAAGSNLEEANLACRWRLNRAGIVNVYQYGNEVLHFKGGRLLLRGVNGSGKSTALNMLLPFLLTTHEGRIDAAGDQSGILRSWMLSGRDDAQPVGYLWIEFRRGGEFLVCGCGIKANRQADSVNTWWFITTKRPGFDLDLVAGGTALSSEALRAELDGDEVFGRARRRDYRRALEQRLFGGAPIEQHIRLINKVRSPRVGDRIDLELRDYLVDALPQVSEQALAEAAQPLDDLDEHRRSVAELARTLDAARGLLDVYRSYCLSDLRRRVADGRQRLRARRDCARDEQSRKEAAAAASDELARLDGDIEALEAEQRRLRREIEALEKSQAYERGRQLEGLRELVLDLAKQCETAAMRVDGAGQRAGEDARELDRTRRTSLNDRDTLNAELAAAGELGSRCRLDRRPPGPVTVPESDIADAATGAAGPTTATAPWLETDEQPNEVPAGPAQTGPGALRLSEPAALDLSGIDRGLAAAVSAVGRRRSDVEQVQRALEAERTAAQGLDQAEAAHKQAAGSVEHAAKRLTERTRRLAAARSEWHQQVRSWAANVVRLLGSTGLDAPNAAAQAEEEPLTAGVAPADPDTLRTRLHAEAEALVDHWRSAVVAVEARLADEQLAEQEAQSLVDELERRVEPEPPRLSWQRESDWCLADLIDFAPGLQESQRAGLEAAMESSGLLSARLADGAFELESGELVAVASQGATSPLSDLLTVTVPQRLAGLVDEGSVQKLLESISCDPASDAATLATVDGEFRVGSLRGRHHKDQPEHIGAAARRAALEKARAEARHRLHETSSTVRRSREELERSREAHHEAHLQRDSLPATAAILGAQARVETDAAALDEAAVRRDEAARAEADAERTLSKTSDALHRTATSLTLPRDRPGLDAFARDLAETDAALQRCRSSVETLSRSVQSWRRACDRWRTAAETLVKEHAERRRVESKHADEHASLATLEDSIGAEYAEVVAARDQCRADLADLEARAPEKRREQRRALEHRAEAEAGAKATAASAKRAEQACEATRVSLDEALATPGYLDAIRAGSAHTVGTHGASGVDNAAASGTADTGRADLTDADTSATDSPSPGSADVGDGPIVTRAAGSEGLREMLEALERLLAVFDDHRDSGRRTARAEMPDVGPDSVRQSLLQRRDALGAGWDAEALQPDPAQPLFVEVTGPSGRATLAESVLAVAQQHQWVAGLLNRKQDDALRQLLQGMIAREIAEKIFEAERLVKHMNLRLGAVATAHRVGVRLRWRRSRELDEATARMVELLAKTPDVRTGGETGELRRALSRRLDDARAEQPELSYRQLIAETLDYRQWHDMAVMVRRGSGESRLSRSTPLSEGEKKLVSYLPLFAAVSASCDALAERQAAPGGEQPGIARFVLLDDAFAKVSEDNHAALFGLLVDLDLDFIATSERLWGTHATVPELAVTEVIRDATLSTILLEHYEWDGTTLSHEGGT